LWSRRIVLAWSDGADDAPFVVRAALPSRRGSHHDTGFSGAPCAGLRTRFSILAAERRSRSPVLYTQADCAYSYPVFQNCFGNNPASPYILPVVEFWPDEYVDPAIARAIGWIPGTADLDMDHRLGEQ
jgi:hypothetical protein